MLEGIARVSERAARRRLLNGWGVRIASWEEEGAAVARSGDEGAAVSEAAAVLVGMKVGGLGAMSSRSKA